jgi:ribonuclease HII
LTKASVIALASSCFWAKVRPGHISTWITGIYRSLVKVYRDDILNRHQRPAGCATIRAKMTAGSRPLPSTRFEEALWASNVRFVAGVDEVGRGPLAGPVYAAAVILHPDRRPGWLSELRDSKVLLVNDRQRLSEAVRSEALAFAIGAASVAEIDAWGIGPANKLAMSRAIAALPLRPQHVLIDGPIPINDPLPQRTIVDGDAICASIAAASIVAKVARDALMCELDALYPQYGFAAHKGYATRHHLEQLARFGPCVQHRRSWLAVQRRAAEGLRDGEMEAADAAR